MFATDKSIADIKKILWELKHYIELHTKFMRLDLAEKLIVLLASAVIVLVLVLFGAIALLFLTFALAYYIGSVTESLPLGFLTVGGGVALLLWVFYANRRRWVVQPVAKFIVNLLINKTKSDAGKSS